jgi:glycerol-3-phosphate dehydrogenase subunit B
MLVSEIERHHGSIYNGMSVSNVSSDNPIITTIWSDSATRQIPHTARNYVLATGGILGGGITTGENGYAQEMVFDLPIKVPQIQSHWFLDQFLSHASHPVHTIGLRVDDELQPIDDKDQISYLNLYAAGNVIGNCDPIRERSLEGIALATGFKIGASLSQRSMP